MIVDRTFLGIVSLLLLATACQPGSGRAGNSSAAEEVERPSVVPSASMSDPGSVQPTEGLLGTYIGVLPDTLQPERKITLVLMSEGEALGEISFFNQSAPIQFKGGWSMVRQDQIQVVWRVQNGAPLDNVLVSDYRMDKGALVRLNSTGAAGTFGLLPQ